MYGANIAGDQKQHSNRTFQVQFINKAPHSHKGATCWHKMDSILPLKQFSPSDAQDMEKIWIIMLCTLSGQGRPVSR